MRLLKTEEFFYVGGGDDGDGRDGGGCDGYTSPGYGVSAPSSGGNSCPAPAAAPSSSVGCSSGVTPTEYGQIASGWNLLGTVAAPFAAISGIGLAVSASAFAVGGYNTYCSWGIGRKPK
jgi:hypothetical protein